MRKPLTYSRNTAEKTAAMNMPMKQKLWTYMAPWSWLMPGSTARAVMI